MQDAASLRRRDASDPTTTTERLDEILRTPWLEQDVRLLVLCNPCCPASALRRCVFDFQGSSGSPKPWSNPMLPLMMLLDPYPDWQNAALRWLRWLSKHADVRCRSRSLAAAIAWWCEREVDPERQALREAREFARVAAGLFGYPWPAKGEHDAL